MEFPVGVKDNAPSTKQYTRLSIRPGPNGSWLVALDDGRHEPQVFMDKHLALSYAKAWAAANRPTSNRSGRSPSELTLEQGAADAPHRAQIRGAPGSLFTLIADSFAKSAFSRAARAHVDRA